MNADQAKWTEISIAFETEPEKRTEKQYFLALCGLCSAAKRMGIWDKGQIGDLHPAYKYVPTLLGVGGGFYSRDYHQTPVRQHDLYRATFAAFMAALSKADIEEMLNDE